MIFCFNRKMKSRAVLYEKTLKHYEKLPLPKVTGIKMFVDLYPDKQTGIYQILCQSEK